MTTNQPLRCPGCGHGGSAAEFAPPPDPSDLDRSLIAAVGGPRPEQPAHPSGGDPFASALAHLSITHNNS